jgi:hypothetical protein
MDNLAFQFLWCDAKTSYVLLDRSDVVHCYIDGCPFEWGSNIIWCIRPRTWFRGCDWLHRCRFLPEASNTFAGSYPGSALHLTVHHVVRSARRSLCFEAELSGLFLIIHWRIPGGALIYRSSQRGISIGPNSFCSWGHLGWCLSILGVVRSLLPPGWALCLGHLVPFLSSWVSASCDYSRNSSYLLDTPCSSTFDSDYTLLGMVVEKGHRHCGCSEVNLYSCKRRIQRVTCPLKFLKLMSQVNAEWSVCRWNSCPYRYLRKFSSVHTMASSSRRVAH